MSRRPPAGLATAATALAVAFAALTVLVAVGPEWLSRADADAASRWHGRGPTGLFGIVGRAGTSAVTVTALAVSVLLLWRRAPRLAIAYAAAMVTTAVATPVLKILVDRPRPEESLVGVDLAAYPSGHAVLVVVLATFVTCTAAALAGDRRWLWVSVGVVMTAVAVTTVAGRVALGAHWPSDIIGGILLGGTLCTTALAWAHSASTLSTRSAQPASSS